MASQQFAFVVPHLLAATVAAAWAERERRRNDRSARAGLAAPSTKPGQEQS